MHFTNTTSLLYTTGKFSIPVVVLFCCLLFIPVCHATLGDILNQYLHKQFENSVPKPTRLWLDANKQTEIKSQINPSQIKLSYRYWQKQDKTVWILDEIGKERDITTGIVINNDSIHSVEVLVYRESRGGQVQNDKFTQQYYQKNLDSNLSKEIDSISGATLSVQALNKQVALALLLNSCRLDLTKDKEK